MRNKCIARMVKFNCPYCGHNNNLHVTSNTPDYFTTTCCAEDGGCDLPVTIKTEWQAKITVFEMKEVTE